MRSGRATGSTVTAPETEQENNGSNKRVQIDLQATGKHLVRKCKRKRESKREREREKKKEKEKEIVRKRQRNEERKKERKKEKKGEQEIKGEKGS